MPAPAVIPALRAYVKVVAVKTLVVGMRRSEDPNVSLSLPLKTGGALGCGGVGRFPKVP